MSSLKKLTVLARPYKKFAKLMWLLFFKLTHPFSPKSIYTSYEHRHLQFYIPPTIETIIDIGFNRGQFSSLCLELFPNVTTWGVEPDSEISESARHQLRTSYGERFKFLPIAVSSKNGICKLYLAKKRDNNSLLFPTQENVKLFASTEIVDSIEVSSMTFNTIHDKYISSQHINSLLIKMDIQGAEYDVLKSIDYNKIKCECWIYAELSSLDLYKYINTTIGDKESHSNQIHKLLLSHGFVLIQSFNRVYTSTGQHLYSDDLFHRPRL